MPYETAAPVAFRYIEERSAGGIKKAMRYEKRGVTKVLMVMMRRSMGMFLRDAL